MSFGRGGKRQIHRLLLLVGVAVLLLRMGCCPSCCGFMVVGGSRVPRGIRGTVYMFLLHRRLTCLSASQICFLSGRVRWISGGPTYTLYDAWLTLGTEKVQYELYHPTRRGERIPCARCIDQLSIGCVWVPRFRGGQSMLPLFLFICSSKS